MKLSKRKKNTRVNIYLLFSFSIVITCLFIFFNSPISAGSENSYFSIHLNTFQEIDLAKSRVEYLKKLGHNAFYRKETDNEKGTLYKVYIENFKSKEEAEKEASVLKRLGLISDYKIAEIKPPGIQPEESSKPAVVKTEEPTKPSNAHIKEPIKPASALTEKPTKPADIKPEEPKKPVVAQPKEPKKPVVVPAAESKKPVAIESQEVKPIEKAYYIQIGSMKEKINAYEKTEDIKKAGYPAFYRKENVPGKGSFYRVYIKGYQTKAAAVKEAKRLIESGVIKDYTIRWFGEIAQPPSNAADSEKKVYFLHVSSFKEKDNAEQYVDILKEQGLKAFLVQEIISNEKWFRVYIGEFDSEVAARKKGAELLKSGIIDYFKPFEIDPNKMK
jgi:cell division septation protein DedD